MDLVTIGCVAGLVAVVAAIRIAHLQEVAEERAEEGQRARFLDKLPAPVRAVVETTHAQLYRPTTLRMHTSDSVETCTAILMIDGESFYIEGVLDVLRRNQNIRAILLRSHESASEVLALVAYERWEGHDELLELLEQNLDLTIEWKKVPYGIRIDRPAEDPCPVRVGGRGILATIRVSDLTPLLEHAELGATKELPSAEGVRNAKNHPTISA